MSNSPKKVAKMKADNLDKIVQSRSGKEVPFYGNQQAARERTARLLEKAKKGK